MCFGARLLLDVNLLCGKNPAGFVRVSTVLLALSLQQSIKTVHFFCHMGATCQQRVAALRLAWSECVRDSELMRVLYGKVVGAMRTGDGRLLLLMAAVARFRVSTYITFVSTNRAYLCLPVKAQLLHLPLKCGVLLFHRWGHSRCEVLSLSDWM